MTVVDVNTGKFTGAGGNLEETVTRNNLEAAEEIVRQLRLRDIGGIIVIDFIDMVLESNRDLVLRRLLECLGRDRTKHQVAEVTSLGPGADDPQAGRPGPARGLLRDRASAATAAAASSTPSRWSRAAEPARRRSGKARRGEGRRAASSKGTPGRRRRRRDRGRRRRPVPPRTSGRGRPGRRRRAPSRSTTLAGRGRRPKAPRRRRTAEQRRVTTLDARAGAAQAAGLTR